jgi:hypothetical protein
VQASQSYSSATSDRCFEEDRKSMTWAFDLWSYTDVNSHAAAIVDSLRDGSMPCDGAWSAEKINVFQRWIDSGMAP